MAKIPITSEDFIALGARFASEDIVEEIDRLAPIAERDIDELAQAGYDRDLLGQLLGHRTQLANESAERRRNRNAGKAATQNERTARDDAIRLLRSGTVLATSAVSTRQKPDDETPEMTREITTKLAADIDSLSGPIGYETATIRTRLTILKGVLQNPDLRPTENRTAAIAQTIADIDRVLAKLPTSTEEKQARKQASIVETAELNEIDGRAYWNLRLLTQAGRTRFRLLRDAERAKPYHLKRLTSSPARPKKPKPQPEP